MADLASREFWRAFADLPDEVQRLARTTFRTFQSNPDHPSLGRKKVQGKPAKFPPGAYEVRVGAHYRAFYIVRGQDREWLWIASHEEASKALRRRNDGGGAMACACGCKGKCRCRAGCKCRRAGNPCGKRHNPVTRRGRGTFTVSFSPQEIANVKRSWPASRLPDRGIQVVLDRHGDFVEARPLAAMENADEQAVQILVESARKHLEESGKIRSGNPNRSGIVSPVAYCEAGQHYPEEVIADAGDDDGVGVLVRGRGGLATNRWGDGVAGVPKSFRDRAEEDEEPSCPEHKSTIRWVHKNERTGNPRKGKFGPWYRRAYQFFAQNAGGVVGQNAVIADNLARAELAAERDMEKGRAEYRWEQEDDPDLSWCDRCQKDRHDGEGHGLWSVLFLIDGQVRGSLGGVDFGPGNAVPSLPYKRVVEAELASEAYHGKRLPSRRNPGGSRCEGQGIFGTVHEGPGKFWQCEGHRIPSLVGPSGSSHPGGHHLCDRCSWHLERNWAVERARQCPLKMLSKIRYSHGGARAGNPSDPIETFMHLDDQPFTCPYCGSRTECEGPPTDKTIHTCPSCGAKMKFEFGDTRDFNPGRPETAVAADMKAKGYRYALIPPDWPHGKRDLLYTKSAEQAARTLREDFAGGKGWRVVSISEIPGVTASRSRNPRKSDAWICLNRLCKGYHRAMPGDTPQECPDCGEKQVLDANRKEPYESENINAASDPHAARELLLYIENDSDLYHSQTVPCQRNLMLKRKRGVYDREKSLKLWGYLVEAGAKKYQKEHGTADFPWWKMFPADVRTQVQRELRDHFEEEAALGNYDDLLDRKKYQAIVSRR